MEDSKNSFVIFAQLVLAITLTFVLQAYSFDKQLWLVGIARYAFYFLLIKASNDGSILLYNIIYKKAPCDPSKIVQDLKSYVLVFGGSAVVLLYNEQRLLSEDFVLLFTANLLLKFNNMEKNTGNISYGVGMACSFFEGYLAHIIPSDGHRFVGFQENIECYENAQGVVFPVRRLFIIMTKTLYSPPDLKAFNKENRDDLPMLEACQSLKQVEKDVAGVKNRIYRNSAYMIRRPGLEPVFIAAECATPLHTLHQVLQNRTLYDDIKNIDVDEVVSDFSKTLASLLSKSRQCQNKCELIYFDDTDPKLNLADVLLDKIRDIEPNFEKIKRT